MTLTWRVLVGDVRDRLATLPDASVQCCVTSPPYWIGGAAPLFATEAA